MRNRHQYYLDNKEHIKAKTSEYYFKHKNDDDYKANRVLRQRRYYREKKEKEEFYKEFKKLKLRVLHLEKILGFR